MLSLWLGNTHNISNVGRRRRHANTDDEIFMATDYGGDHYIVTNFVYEGFLHCISGAVKFPFHLRGNEWGGEATNSFGNKSNEWVEGKRGTEYEWATRSNFGCRSFDGFCTNARDLWCCRRDVDIHADWDGSVILCVFIFGIQHWQFQLLRRGFANLYITIPIICDAIRFKPGIDKLAGWPFDLFFFFLFAFFGFTGSTGLKNHFCWTSLHQHISAIVNRSLYPKLTISRKAGDDLIPYLHQRSVLWA